MFFPGEIGNPVGLFKVDMPEHLKEQPFRKAVSKLFVSLKPKGLKHLNRFPYYLLCPVNFLLSGAGFLRPFLAFLLSSILLTMSPIPLRIFM